MMLPYIALILLGGIILLFVLIGMARYDMANFRLKKIIVKTPYAKSLRARPTVYITTPGLVNKSHYKKLLTLPEKSPTPNVLLLHTNESLVLKPRVFIQAVQGLTTGIFKAVALTPILTIRPTIPSLFHTYATLAQLPIDVARAGLGISPRIGLHKHGNKVTHHYERLALVAKIVNLIIFIYACYAASKLHQPELILMYIFALSFWLIWSILRYPYFSVAKKVQLLALAPITFVYFIYLVIIGPFRPQRII